MSIRIHHFVLLAFVLFVLSGNAFAITDEEIFRNFTFSFANPGARSSAMGGAFIGLADDATAAEANPAGLTILTKPEVSFEYRNVQYDEDRLNFFSEVQSRDAGILIGSFNTLHDLNQPSFLSVVFPSKQTTYGFSRQELSKIDGGIDEIFVITLPGAAFDFGARASENLKVVNWNFSVASKLTDDFSVGVSLRYSQLDWEAGVKNVLLLDSISEPAFETALNDTDSAFAWNLGALYQMGPHAAVGAVYKRNPKFEVEEVEAGPAATKPGSFTNVLKVPDTYGFGIAVKPNDKMTIVADLVRIESSDLTEDLQVGYNVLTATLNSNDISYKIDNATEFHIGAEFVVIVKNTPVAIRQGYYRKASNSLVVDTTPGLSEDGRKLIEAVFPDRADEDHFTLGNGFVFGPHFQIDWAIDLANTADNFVLSTVVRF